MCLVVERINRNVLNPVKAINARVNSGFVVFQIIGIDC